MKYWWFFIDRRWCNTLLSRFSHLWNVKVRKERENTRADKIWLLLPRRNRLVGWGGMLRVLFHYSTLGEKKEITSWLQSLYSTSRRTSRKILIDRQNRIGWLNFCIFFFCIRKNWMTRNARAKSLLHILLYTIWLREKRKNNNIKLIFR